MIENKSTVEEIRQRFDADVERFSNLETGQSATVDAPLAMSLIAEVAAAITPKATSVLDVGCGAGNYTLKLLERLPNLSVTLIDLSRPMLDRAVERIQAVTSGKIEAIQGDIREIDIGHQQHDIILAASVLAPPAGRFAVASGVHEVLHGLATGRVDLDFRLDREFDSRGPGHHASSLRRIPDAAKGRSVPRSSLRLRREGGYAPVTDVPVGLAAGGRFFPGRSPA